MDGWLVWSRLAGDTRASGWLTARHCSPRYRRHLRALLPRLSASSVPVHVRSLHCSRCHRLGVGHRLVIVRRPLGIHFISSAHSIQISSVHHPRTPCTVLLCLSHPLSWPFPCPSPLLPPLASLCHGVLTLQTFLNVWRLLDLVFLVPSPLPRPNANPCIAICLPSILRPRASVWLVVCDRAVHSFAFLIHCSLIVLKSSSGGHVSVIVLHHGLVLSYRSIDSCFVSSRLGLSLCENETTDAIVACAVTPISVPAPTHPSHVPLPSPFIVPVSSCDVRSCIIRPYLFPLATLSLFFSRDLQCPSNDDLIGLLALWDGCVLFFSAIYVFAGTGYRNARKTVRSSRDTHDLERFATPVAPQPSA